MTAPENADRSDAATVRPRESRAHCFYAGVLVTITALGAGAFLFSRYGFGVFEALMSPWPLPFAVAFTPACVLLLFARRPKCALAAGALAVWAGALWISIAMPTAQPPDTATAAAPASASDSAPAPARSDLFRIIEINVNAGVAPTPEVIDWIVQQDPDLLVVIECTTRWKLQLDQALPGMPGRVTKIQENPGGIALYSRKELGSGNAFESPVGGFPHLEAQIETDLGPLRVFAIHTIPPMRRSLAQTRDDELELAAEWANPRMTVAGATPTAAGTPPTVSPLPCIVIGDFNETPWGRAYRQFVRDSGLVSARDGHGLGGSWHSSLSAILRIPIDHCFLSPALAKRVVRTSIGPLNGSDHLPLVVDLDKRATTP